MRFFELVVLRLSAAGFLIHLLLIFLSRTFGWNWSTVTGGNYLAAIYTPFTIILFHEVLILISAIPQSPAESVATQFEIVSLIFIRGFFKEIGEMDFGQLEAPTVEMLSRLLENVGGGLFLFFLVTLFKRAALRRDPRDAVDHSPEMQIFVLWKKGMALAVTALFIIMAVSGIKSVLVETNQVVFHGATKMAASKLFFYNDVFSIMIFTDVLILILSLVVSGQYEFVFRNAAFVVSRTLMRFALLSEQPWSVVFATVGMVFAILTILVYNYGRKYLVPGAPLEEVP